MKLFQCYGHSFEFIEGETLVYKDEKYEIYRNVGLETIIQVGKLWKNCLRYGERDHVLLLPVIFTLYRKDAPKYKKYRKWICADFLADEYKGPINKRIEKEAFMEMRELYRTVIRTLEPEYFNIVEFYMRALDDDRSGHQHWDDEVDYYDYDYDESNED